MLFWTLLLSFACAQPPATDAGRQKALDSAYERYDFTFPKVQEIDAATLKARLAKGDDLVLVDTRPIEERKVSILPGAISMEVFEQNRSTYQDKQVITYCTVGVRSGIAANKLRKDGVDVLNFKGSILAWTHADGPLVTPAGASTRQVHVYGSSWNFAALDYKAVLTKPDGTVYPAP